ncbi:MAG: NHLP leader peptide family RiPP precursor [Nitrospirae bacterium]|nr:NHLP leader peptide family RiPP precursor [Nitrospirota bacterium]
MEESKEHGKKMTEVVCKAWLDESFKAKLMSAPHATLKEHGINVPVGKTVKVVEDTDDIIHIHVPKRPNYVDDEDLQKVVEGNIIFCMLYMSVAPCNKLFDLG